LTEKKKPRISPENSAGDLNIRKLSIQEHKKILNELDFFWITQVPVMKPLHHPLFALVFSNFSFVLCKGLQIVSYVYAVHNNKKGFIHIIATRAGHYQKGYASFLLNHLEKTAREINLKSLWAYCLPNNFSSRGLFEKNQFIMQKEIEISADEKRVLYKKVI